MAGTDSMAILFSPNKLSGRMEDVAANKDHKK